MMEDQELQRTRLAKQRTLLAAERTFFAWIRTALTAMGGAVAILRLITFKTDLHRTIAHGIGEMLIIWSCMLIIMSAADYKKAHKQLYHEHNHPHFYLRLFVIVAPLIIMAALLILVTLP